MGYYVNIDEAHLVLPMSNAALACKRLCDLNDRNDLKNGGKWPRDENIVGPHEDIWFSWMPWNYPDIYSDAKQILEAVGFDTWLVGDDLHICGYDNKSGCQEEFLAAIGDLLKPHAYVVWRGECGETWRFDFEEAGIVKSIGVLSFEHQATVDYYR